MNYKYTNILLLLTFTPQMWSTDYKTGIDVNYSNNSQNSHISEDLFYNPIVWDRKVTYINESTEISLSHNSRNIMPKTPRDPIGILGLDGLQNSGDEGLIRFLVDRDGHKYNSWALPLGGTPTAIPYTAPFTFSSLTYESGDPVVGTTGHSTGDTSNPDDYYRGHLDEFGDEWHIIAVADDDTWAIPSVTRDAWESATDGKLHHYVVNPKTPAIQISANGDAQFYTTPPKAYRIPKIHRQTSYIDPGSGTITITIKSLNGEAIYFRINEEEFSKSETGIATLQDTLFAHGENTIQYFIEGNEAHTKTRKLVKLDRTNPQDFPSANEGHGNLLWGNFEEFTKIKSRVTNPKYEKYYKSYRRFVEKANDNGQSPWDQYGGKGLRLGKRYYREQQAFTNAFVALIQGFESSVKTETGSGSSKPYAEYAKEMLLENIRTIDPVGFEIYHKGSEGIPSNEQNYIGYYDINPLFDMNFSYDILIANYRSDQYSNGITPVEDYYIRDRLASFVSESATILGYWMYFYRPEMWGSARTICALTIALNMNQYNSPVYGVSGFDGTTEGHYNTPFPDYDWTWKRIFNDESIPEAEGIRWPKSTYPNPFSGLGVEQAGVGGYGLINEQAQWGDKTAYFNNGLMGSVYQILLNITKINSDIRFPYLEQACFNATQGTLMGFKFDISSGYSGPTYVPMPWLVNSRFPSIYDSHKEQALEQMGYTESIFTLLWLDPGTTLTSEQKPIGPNNLSVIAKEPVSPESAGGATTPSNTGEPVQ